MTPWLILAALAFAQTLAASLILTPLARRHGEALGLVDRPTLERKIHTVPTPRSGGVAIFAAFWGCVLLNLTLAAYVVPQLAFLPDAVRVLAANATANVGGVGVQFAGLFAGCLMIFVLGVADDRLNLPAKLRLAIQFAATIPVIATGTQLNLFLPWPVGAAVTAFWMVLLTNSLNFLDNMNGLTSGIAAIVCAVLAVQSALSAEWLMLLLFAMLCGAAMGFWRYNFFGGGIFLGDSGSTHFGFLLASLTVMATYWQTGVPSRLPVLLPVLVLAVPLFDTASVLWIRWRSGKSFFEGDTNHVSHRLVALGFSRREAVLMVYGFTAAVGLAALALRQLDWVHGLIQTAMIALLFVLLHRIERVSRAKVAG